MQTNEKYAMVRKNQLNRYTDGPFFNAAKTDTHQGICFCFVQNEYSKPAKDTKRRCRLFAQKNQVNFVYINACIWDPSVID